MYSTRKAKDVQKKDVAFISVGIQEDITLTGFKIDKSPSGKRFMEFRFTKGNATNPHTEWEPAFNKEYDTIEKFEDKCTNQVSRVMQILGCYFNEDELNFEGESFTEFCEWVSDMLDKADKSKKLRAKFVYNDNNYITLPKYAKYTFIEPMELPEGQSSKITILKIDNLEKVVIADNDLKSTEEIKSEKVEDDMPF